MTKLMKAAFIKRFGNPEVIEWGDQPLPQINDDQVLVKINAVTLDHVDTYIRAGKYTFSKPLAFPYILGHDLVGVVEKVGKNVKNFQPGQRVWGNAFGEDGRQGSFAEYVAGDPLLFNPIPKEVDDIQMVANIHSATTVCHGLIRIAKLLANETIFVNGGGGAIGSALIQLSSIRGARVFAATTGKEKMEWCKSCGAEQVFDYQTDDFEKKVKEILPQGVDIFWDTSHEPHFDLSVSLIKTGGRIILMAGAQARSPFPVGPFYRKDGILKGFNLKNATPEILHDYAEIINRCVKENVLRAKIAEVLPLSDAAKAHSRIESNPNIWGKIVLKNSW